jgi:hypothetical protein
MTRVRSKANPEIVGTVLEDVGSELWVQWDDHEYPGQRWRIARDRVEEIPEQPRDIHLSLLDAIDRLRVNFHLELDRFCRNIDRLRDNLNLALECIERDIRREMKK